MAEYKCGNCGAIIKEPIDSSGTIQCPQCRYKIFFKTRQPIARDVTAR